MELTVILCFYFFIIIFDFYPIAKKKNKKESWVYLVTLIFTFCILTLYGLDVTVPSPAILIKSIIISIT